MSSIVEENIMPEQVSESKNKKNKIPDGWHEVRLGDICKYFKGFAFKSLDYQFNGRRIVRVSDMGFDYIKDDSNAIFIDEEKAKIYKRWELKKDDLVVTTVGSKPPIYDSLVGRTIFVQSKDEFSLLNQNAVCLRAVESVNQKYFNNLFKRKRYISFIESIIRGNANQGSITLEDLFEFEVQLPPIKEQEAIADILSGADEVIETTKEKIDLLKLRKKSLMQKLFAPKPHWIEKELGDVCEINKHSLSENTDGNYSFKYIDLSMVNNGVIDYPKTNLIFKNAPSRARRIFKKKDILMATVRPNLQGHCYINKDVKNYVCSTGFAVISEKENISNNLYIYPHLFTKKLNKQIEDCLVGSNYPAINSSDVKSLKIPLPPIEEQGKIACVLATCDEEIKLWFDKLTILERQKKGLMQKLLTGKWRVKINKEAG